MFIILEHLQVDALKADIAIGSQRRKLYVRVDIPLIIWLGISSTLERLQILDHRVGTVAPMIVRHMRWIFVTRWFYSPRCSPTFVDFGPFTQRVFSTRTL